MKKKKVIILILLFIFFSITLVYSLIKIVNYLGDNSKNREIKKDLDKSIEVLDDKIKIDFNKLKEKNSDTVGYIKVNNTSIDYVVVKGSNNSFYLKHNFNKDYNISGWIFSDYRNMVDGNDKNLIIYGHSTKDGSMFGTLKDTLNSNWQENNDNHYVTFVSPNNTYIYQVFSTYIIEPEDYYITTEFSGDDEFNTFINKLLSRSNYDYHIKVSGEDKIITLSSCNISGSKRIVLHAKLIEVME